MWEPIAAAPFDGRDLLYIAVDQDRVVLYGGVERRGDQSVGPLDGGLYYPAEDRWEYIPAAPLEPRDDPAIRYRDGKLIVYGGQATEPDGATAETPEFRTDGAVHDLTTHEWTALPAVGESSRQGPLMQAFDGEEIVLFGDEQTGEDRLRSGAVVGLDGTITEIPDAPLVPEWPNHTAWDGIRLLVFSGYPPGIGEAGDDLWHRTLWNRNTGTWTPLTATHLAAHATNNIVGVTAADDGALVLWSGEDDKTVSDPPAFAIEYRLESDAWGDFERLAALTWGTAQRSNGTLAFVGEDPNNGRPAAFVDTSGEVHEVDPPWDGDLIAPGVLLSDLSQRGPTVSVRLGDSEWLAAEIPGDPHQSTIAATVLGDDSVFVLDGESGRGWRLIIDEPAQSGSG